MAEDRTKGVIEAKISKAIIKFEKKYMGWGPSPCRETRSISEGTPRPEIEPDS